MDWLSFGLNIDVFSNINKPAILSIDLFIWKKKKNRSELILKEPLRRFCGQDFLNPPTVQSQPTFSSPQNFVTCLEGGPWEDGRRVKKVLHI